MRCKRPAIWTLKRSLADNGCVLKGKCYSSKWGAVSLPTTLKLACGVFVPGGREGCWVPHRFLTAVLQRLMKQTAMMYQSSVRMQSSVKIQWAPHRFKNREKCCGCLFPSIITSHKLVMIKVWFLLFLMTVSSSCAYSRWHEAMCLSCCSQEKVCRGQYISVF